MQQRIWAVVMVFLLVGCKKLAEQNFRIKPEAFKDEKWQQIVDSLYEQRSKPLTCIHYLTYDSVKAELHIKYAKDECRDLFWVEHYLQQQNVLWVDTITALAVDSVQIDSVSVEELQPEPTVSTRPRQPVTPPVPALITNPIDSLSDSTSSTLLTTPLQDQ